MLLGRLGSSTRSRSVVTDVLGLPESLHHHGVHGGEVSLDGLNASVWMADTEVLLEVESVLCYPEWISHVGPHHL